MWMPKSVFETRLFTALQNGTSLKRTEFTEDELLAAAPALAASPLFGDFVELLLLSWQDLDDAPSAAKAICIGLRKNTSRDAVIHAVDAIIAAELVDLGPFARTLDALAGDEEAPLAIRVEAVVGLTRFALQNRRFTAYASSGVLRLLEVEDDLVKAKLCRIVSVLHDQLEWPEAIDSLKILSRCEACSVEANLELGFVEMANAFRSTDLPTMSLRFEQSAERFEESFRISEGAPRARMYGSVARALAGAFSNEAPQVIDLRALNSDAQWVAHYQVPRAGARWLTPPPDAELEWLPLLAQPQEPTATDRFGLLASAVRLFEQIRSVGFRANGEQRYRPPQGFSQLTEQGCLLGAMRRWIDGNGASSLTDAGRSRLSTKLSQLGAPPGKA